MKIKAHFESWQPKKKFQNGERVIVLDSVIYPQLIGSVGVVHRGGYIMYQLDIEDEIKRYWFKYNELLRI